MMIKIKKGQSILEYVIVLTVIVAAIMAASGYMHSSIQGGMDKAADSIVNSLGVASGGGS
ncbi:MAG: hypothetical protein NTY14_02360 [Candidatus Omnitrophica bacterium]|nr:hypothetical protein [Candidatus Omnitrophota bacterium]